ncbi:MAG: hypothetical protein IT307_17880 [Chloroflexi bacterium]|nr:hypothetical protein [Chloroflexota bacterium]
MREATFPAQSGSTAATKDMRIGGPGQRRLAGGWREALLVALGLGLWSLAVRGYGGGRWWDVPVIKSFMDPSLYRMDPFVTTLHNGTPAVYPYQLIAAFADLLPMLPLDQALFLLYAPASLAALAILYRIALRFSGDRVVAVLFLFLYVAGFRLITVGTTILHSGEATPQTLSLPFQLAAIWMLMNGRLAIAGALMGLGFYLHTPSTIYMAGALGLYEVLSIRRLGFRPVAVSLGLLAAIGAPTILGSLLHHADQMPLWALELARFATASDISLLAHFSTRPLILYNLLGLAMTALVVRQAPADQFRRMALLFFLTVGLMCLGALLFVDVSLKTPLSTTVERLQLTRSAWVFNLFGLLYLTRHFVVGWRDGTISRPLVLLLVAVMVAAPPSFNQLDPLLFAGGLLLLAQGLLPHGAASRIFWWTPWALAASGAVGGLAHLEVKEFDFDLSLRTAIDFAGLALGWGLYETLARRGWSAARAAPALLVGMLVTAGVQLTDEWLFTSAHKGGLKSAAEFQQWARTQTPKDSVFLILPGEVNNHTFYQNAERAHFLVRERAQWIVYFQSHTLEFERRVRALGVDSPMKYREDLDAAYRRLTEDKVRQLARDFGVTHFVPARAGNFSFPIVYQQGSWTVYQVTP